MMFGKTETPRVSSQDAERDSKPVKTLASWFKRQPKPQETVGNETQPQAPHAAQDLPKRKLKLPFVTKKRRTQKAANYNDGPQYTLEPTPSYNSWAITGGAAQTNDVAEDITEAAWPKALLAAPSIPSPDTAPAATRIVSLEWEIPRSVIGDVSLVENFAAELDAAMASATLLSTPYTPSPATAFSTTPVSSALVTPMVEDILSQRRFSPANIVDSSIHSPGLLRASFINSLPKTPRVCQAPQFNDTGSVGLGISSTRSIHITSESTVRTASISPPDSDQQIRQDTPWATHSLFGSVNSFLSAGSSPSRTTARITREEPGSADSLGSSQASAGVTESITWWNTSPRMFKSKPAVAEGTQHQVVPSIYPAGFQSKFDDWADLKQELDRNWDRERAGAAIEPVPAEGLQMERRSASENEQSLLKTVEARYGTWTLPSSRRVDISPNASNDGDTDCESDREKLSVGGQDDGSHGRDEHGSKRTPPATRTTMVSILEAATPALEVTPDACEEEHYEPADAEDRRDYGVRTFVRKFAEAMKVLARRQEEQYARQVAAAASTNEDRGLYTEESDTRGSLADASNGYAPSNRRDLEAEERERDLFQYFRDFTAAFPYQQPQLVAEARTPVSGWSSDTDEEAMRITSKPARRLRPIVCVSRAVTGVVKFFRGTRSATPNA